MWLRTDNVLLVGTSGREAVGGLERGITQEVVFDVLCFGGCVVRASQGDPPWVRQLHANHQGRIPGLQLDRRETNPGGFLCFCVL